MAALSGLWAPLQSYTSIGPPWPEKKYTVSKLVDALLELGYRTSPFNATILVIHLAGHKAHGSINCGWCSGTRYRPFNATGTCDHSSAPPDNPREGGAALEGR